MQEKNDQKLLKDVGSIYEMLTPLRNGLHFKKVEY